MSELSPEAKRLMEIAREEFSPADQRTLAVRRALAARIEAAATSGELAEPGADGLGASKLWNVARWLGIGLFAAAFTTGAILLGARGGTPKHSAVESHAPATAPALATPAEVDTARQAPAPAQVPATPAAAAAETALATPPPPAAPAAGAVQAPAPNAPNAPNPQAAQREANDPARAPNDAPRPQLAAAATNRAELPNLDRPPPRPRTAAPNLRSAEVSPQPSAANAPATSRDNVAEAVRAAPAPIANEGAGAVSAPQAPAPAADTMAASGGPGDQLAANGESSADPSANAAHTATAANDLRTATTSRTTTGVIAPGTPVSQPLEPQRSGATAAPAPAKRPAPVPVIDDALRRELALLRRANAALGRHDGSAALAATNEHAAQFPMGRLRQERVAVRALALCALGRMDEAKLATEELQNIAPRSPHLSRIHMSCLTESQVRTPAQPRDSRTP